MRTRRSLIFLISLALIVFILAGCKLTTQNGTLSGKLIDSSSGQPISGAMVTFAGSSLTTVSDGSFSFDLGKQAGTVTGDFGFSATGYPFAYLSSVSVDAGASPHVLIPVGAATPSGSTHTVTVTVQKEGGAQIGSGASVTLFIYNSNGGMSKFSTTYQTGGTAFTSYTFGSDCLFVVFDNADGFVAMKRQVDFSADTTVTLTQDTTTTKTVVVTGDANGNNGGAVLVTPYGPVLAAGYTLSGTTASVPVANPYGYPVYWVQVQTQTNVGGTGSDKKLISASSPAALQDAPTLPAIVGSLGPTAPNATAEATSLGYTAPTLSVASVTGATMYIFIIGGPSVTGVAVSGSASVALPTWVTSVLSGTIPVGAGAADSDFGTSLSSITALLVGQLAYGIPPSNMHFGSVNPSGGGFYTNPSVTF